ncbi:hypothetical protein PILCRDRAFT_825297, partial [Piloderma croceum F 1598]
MGAVSSKQLHVKHSINHALSTPMAHSNSDGYSYIMSYALFQSFLCSHLKRPLSFLIFSSGDYTFSILLSTILITNRTQGIIEWTLFTTHIPLTRTPLFPFQKHKSMDPFRRARRKLWTPQVYRPRV